LGQFLDHDITATPHSNEAAPIADIPGDVIVGAIPFNRSMPIAGTGINGIPREQFNAITTWIDASNVYGSDIAHANNLRTFTDGKLKVSTATNGEDILPIINGNFTAGDERALEQPGLTSLHILFVREHNRICHELKNCGMTNDEAIYQKARKQVGALLQSVSFHEFLPALGVQLPPYNGYNTNIQPNISNVFATAGFRLGHTMVTDNVVQFDDNGNQINSLSLAQAFFNSSLTQNNGIEGFLNGLANQFQEEVDAKIVESLRSFLFAPTPTGPGLDLAALNIQRGRDHGLDDYNAFRNAFGISPANNFVNITSNATLQNQLANAYNNNVNNIDVWVGLLSEDHLPGASIGATLHAILAEQFTALRDGDFYFFENDPALTAMEKTIIRNTRLSDIIKRNTNIQNIKADVFYGPCSNSYAPAVTYDAGNQVRLKPGFKALEGSRFHAFINGCGGAARPFELPLSPVLPVISEILIKNYNLTEATLMLPGCTDSKATNYNPIANIDDGTCNYIDVFEEDYHFKDSPYFNEHAQKVGPPELKVLPNPNNGKFQQVSIIIKLIVQRK